MPYYTEMFKRKMVQKLTGPDAISACALSKQVDVSQSSLSTWLRNASVNPIDKFTNHSTDDARQTMAKPPQHWSAEDKLKAVLEADSIPDSQLGAYLRKKGIH
jgi:transposase